MCLDFFNWASFADWRSCSAPQPLILTWSISVLQWKISWLNYQYKRWMTALKSISPLISWRFNHLNVWIQVEKKASYQFRMNPVASVCHPLKVLFTTKPLSHGWLILSWASSGLASFTWQQTPRITAHIWVTTLEDKTRFVRDWNNWNLLTITLGHAVVTRYCDTVSLTHVTQRTPVWCLFSCF